jgi:uncharacterized glyoxalase superfamily protein PhnB
MSRLGSVTPRIITPDVVGVVAWMQAVLGAEAEVQADQPTEVVVGDSIVMVSDGGGVRPPYPAFLYVYVENVDAAFERALEHGVQEVVEEPSDQPYGDRRATVIDPQGNTWQLAHPLP